MSTLPAQPNLDQLRNQAKDLLRAARAGDAGAIARIRAVSDRLTLAAAQLALARELGFAGWAKLKAEVEARAEIELAARAAAFAQASVSGDIRRAARLLGESPALAGSSFTTAVILGDAGRVRDELARDPGLATRPEPHSGWTALHAACASRWHQLEPARGAGLLAVASLLLDAGADPAALTPRRPRGGGWRPLRCVIAAANSGPSNRPVAELLLDRGAVPDDHDLYLAGFAPDRDRLLPLLLGRVADVRGVAAQALAAPLSSDDHEAARLLLEAGADPARYRDDDGRPVPIVWAAVRARCSDELVELLLVHGADAAAAGPDGRTPHQLATAGGRAGLAGLLLEHGAADTATPADRFLSACRRADRAGARKQLADDPGLLDRLTAEERAAIVGAAEAGDTAAVALMLDLGFSAAARRDDGATPLHAAAYAGSVDTVRLLIGRGAEVEARDASWDSTPLEWAAVGSGERPRDAPVPDWLGTVRALLDAGAAADRIGLAPEDPKPPSGEVAALLRAHARAQRSR